MNASKSWGENKHTVRCTNPIYPRSCSGKSSTFSLMFTSNIYTPQIGCMPFCLLHRIIIGLLKNMKHKNASATDGQKAEMHQHHANSSRRSALLTPVTATSTH